MYAPFGIRKGAVKVIYVGRMKYGKYLSGKMQQPPSLDCSTANFRLPTNIGTAKIKMFRFNVVKNLQMSNSFSTERKVLKRPHKIERG